MAAKGYTKLVEDISTLSVLELSELIKVLEDKFGVSAAMPTVAAAPAAGGAPAAEAVEEKSEYTVTLKEAGTEKIKAIKAVKGATGMGLAEAKKAVESAPIVIAEGVKKEDAEKIKSELEAIGAKVELS